MRKRGREGENERLEERKNEGKTKKKKTPRDVRNKASPVHYW